MMKTCSFVLFMLSVAMPLGCVGPFSPCLGELSPDALGVSQGVVGRVYDVDPWPICRDDEIEFITVDTPMPSSGLIANAFLEQEGQRVVSTAEGIFSADLEPGPWFACLNLDYDEEGRYEVYCIEASVDEGEVVELTFSRGDSGYTLYNEATTSQSQVPVYVDEVDEDA